MAQNSDITAILGGLRQTTEDDQPMWSATDAPVDKEWQTGLSARLRGHLVTKL